MSNDYYKVQNPKNKPWKPTQQPNTPSGAVLTPGLDDISRAQADAEQAEWEANQGMGRKKKGGDKWYVKHQMTHNHKPVKREREVSTVSDVGSLLDEFEKEIEDIEMDPVDDAKAAARENALQEQRAAKNVDRVMGEISFPKLISTSGAAVADSSLDGQRSEIYGLCDRVVGNLRHIIYVKTNWLKIHHITVAHQVVKRVKEQSNILQHIIPQCAADTPFTKPDNIDKYELMKMIIIAQYNNILTVINKTREHTVRQRKNATQEANKILKCMVDISAERVKRSNF